LHQRTLPISLY